MKFSKEHIDHSPLVDGVFKVSARAKAEAATLGEDQVVNATIGSLYSEDGKLVALNTVFDTFNAIENTQKAKYAGGITGNADYRAQVYNWVVQDVKLDLAHSVVATPGGTGSIDSTLVNILDAGQTVVLPDIAWGSYKLMATMANLKVKNYSMFDGDHFNMDSFKQVTTEVMEEQGKVLVILNAPCHNPTGYSLSDEEWNELVLYMNEISKKGPFVLLNDIAYIDYSYNLPASRDYMKHFNDIEENVMVIIAFSCSKTLTSYGLRCGASVILAKQEESVKEVEILFEKHARACWSNVPNAPMVNFVEVTTKKLKEFNEEKQYYIDLLKERSDLFKKEADECGLSYYPYKEGFFVTIKVEDKDLLDKYHEALMDQHIFTVKVNKGIRVGVCSISVAKCKGLAYKMKEVLDSIQ